MDNPLQLLAYNKRKFHLRVYVLAIGNLQVYVYEDILALFCLETYSKSDADTQDINMRAHITNTCYQLDHLTAGEEVSKAEGNLKLVSMFKNLNLEKSYSR